MKKLLIYFLIFFVTDFSRLVQAGEGHVGEIRYSILRPTWRSSRLWQPYFCSVW